MLQPTETSWATTGQNFAAVDGNTDLGHDMGLASESLAVSTLDTSALLESQPANAELVASTLPTGFSNSAAMSGTDTAVMAVAFLGVWMLLVGCAMLARHVRIIKTTSFTRARSH